MKRSIFNINHSGVILNGFIPLLVLVMLFSSCSEKEEETPIVMEEEEEEIVDDKVEGVDYFLPKIDLSNWKVTLPIGKPIEVEPPEILNYGSNETVLPFMYNDSTDASLVFYTYPGATTNNSSYSRTELREQMVPGSNNTNWTFAQGGNMKGTLKVDQVTNEDDGDPHRIIIMQIHGRLTNQQRNLINEDDNNAPPVLKIYWNEGRIRVHRKILKDLDVNNIDILKTSAWTDEAEWLGDPVDYDAFTLEIDVSDGYMAIILNGEDRLEYTDIHVAKWGIFENYFKAGNYLQSTDPDASSTIKYYDLEISH